MPIAKFVRPWNLITVKSVWCSHCEQVFTVEKQVVGCQQCGCPGGACMEVREQEQITVAEWRRRNGLDEMGRPAAA